MPNQPLLTLNQVGEIRQRYASEHDTVEDIYQTLADDFGISRDRAWKVVAGYTYDDPDYTPPPKRNKKRTDRVVLECLLAYMRAHGGAAPTQQEIADHIGYLRGTVSVALRRLEQQKKIYAHGSRQSRIYRIRGIWYPVSKDLFKGLDDE